MGYSPWSHERVGHDLWTKQQQVFEAASLISFLNLSLFQVKHFQSSNYSQAILTVRILFEHLKLQVLIRENELNIDRVKTETGAQKRGAQPTHTLGVEKQNKRCHSPNVKTAEDTFPCQHPCPLWRGLESRSSFIQLKDEPLITA